MTPLTEQVIASNLLEGIGFKHPANIRGLWKTCQLNSATQQLVLLSREALRKKEQFWSAIALSWQIAVLKILASSKDGEAAVASVSKDLSLLVSANDGWDERLRRSIPHKIPHDIFSNGLVTRPIKGRWRISPSGRDYLRSLEHRLDFDQAAE